MTPWVRRLIVANIVVFFLQQTAPAITNALVFVPRYIFVQPWTVVTYMFLHGGITHILFNMLGLYFFGPRVEERIGSNRFITLYGISGVSGAILSMFFAPNAPIIGASGAVFGVMLAFARFWPTAQIYIMGILPLEARFAVILFALISLWSGFNGSRGGVADFAHLGGFVGAWAYLTWLDRRAGARSFRAQTTPKIGKDVLGNWRRVDPKAVHEVNRDEVNRILDKISATGLGSLTPTERLFLSNFVPPDDRVPPIS
ncbi:MAG: Peptidase rhomboid domain protein [Gemmatimonadetes bacterium]|nr:Peptidase rhomboid domain protein [Gemmatimonadota bacterium]